MKQDWTTFKIEQVSIYIYIMGLSSQIMLKWASSNYANICNENYQNGLFPSYYCHKSLKYL